MAKVSYLQLEPEQEELYFRWLKPGDRFTFSRIVRKKMFFSRRSKKGFTQKSLLPQITELWNGFSDEIRQAWNDAAAYSNMAGFRLFVQDQSRRIINEIEGTATPSNYHQCFVGVVQIDAPASAAKIIQIHPGTYWVLRKVSGTKSQFEPKRVQEFFGLPFTIGISFKSDLEAAGDNPSCKFYAVVNSSYQGAGRDNIASVTIPLQSDWDSDTAILNSLNGYFVSYNLFIELVDVRGQLLFDNIISNHNAQNYARDPQCNNVATTFTRAFFQIPKHWAPVDLPDGANYATIYPED